MQVYGSAAISDLLGELLAYRSLRPCDRQLPGFRELAATLGMAATLPRKGDPSYGLVVAEMLRAAQRATGNPAQLQRLIVLGDTRAGDGGAFSTLVAATGWDGRAFICVEAPDKPASMTSEAGISIANRWSLLHEFSEALDTGGFVIDRATVVVIDIDKTLLGARGRNDKQIDDARLTALRSAVAAVLGDGYDPAQFDTSYRALNQQRFYPLTADNQDYVGYLCVLVASEIFSLEHLGAIADTGATDFVGLLRQVEDACEAVGWESRRFEHFHEQIAALVDGGDPTPFKEFRRREFGESTARMGTLADDTPAEELLRHELVLTGEVWEVARDWQSRGALLFGLSDKPDEAALPEESGAAPLHHIKTHIVGS